MQRTLLDRHNVTIVGHGQRTMVLAHGFGTDQSAWNHLVDAFSSRFRMILFDHVGATPANQQAFNLRRYSTISGYALDLLQIYEALELHDTIYIGHSMSGMIGVRAALSQPERFAKLILIGASPHYLNSGSYRGGFDQRDLDLLYEAMQANYTQWASAFASLAMGNPDRPELGLDFARTLGTLRPDIALAVARVIFQSDERALLPRLKLPTLVIQAQKDIAVPMFVAEYMRDQIERSRLCAVDAEGHLPHYSAPAEVIAAIEEDLRATLSTRPGPPRK
jgi:sigma-B regulation protein RsbQ